MGFFSWLLLLLIGLKLTGFITVSWFIVLLPVTVWIAIFMTVFLTALWLGR